MTTFVPGPVVLRVVAADRHTHSSPRQQGVKKRREIQAERLLTAWVSLLLGTTAIFRSSLRPRSWVSRCLA